MTLLHRRVPLPTARTRMQPDVSGALRRAVGELLVAAEPPQLPDATELARLHVLLRERLRTGNTAMRKSVFNALIESLVVHGREDIAPTFRLLAAQPAEDAMAAAEQATAGVHPSTAEVAVEGSVFAHRDSGWS